MKTRTIPYRRKASGKTDYRLRLTLLRGRKPRIVIRKSLKYITIQVIQYSPKGDNIVVSATTKELLKMGWKYGLKNTSASYLCGLLFAKKAKEKKIASGIIDLGMYTTTKGSKLFAAVKGIVDGGVDVKTDDKIFPPKERLEGKHIASHAALNSAQFSVVSKNADLSQIQQSMNKVKEMILK